MKRGMLCASVVVMILIAACSKNTDGASTEVEETVTPVGTPLAAAITKTIDVQGGEMASADGTLRVVIPAGAVSAATEISIQPISNQLAEGIGTAYRLTPHGQQFSKPVTLIFNYKDEDTADTRPEALAIAYQDDKGAWQMLTNTTVDKVEKKLLVTTTHFSDWGYFKSIKLTPAEATVELGGFLELQATTTFPRMDPDDATPGTYTAPVLKRPRKLRPDEIDGWTYAGAGTLDPDGSWAFYTAPEQEPSVNPEAVAVQINMKRMGKFMLISNITVLSNKRVDYLQVDEDYARQGNNLKCRLYIYGAFGNDPGSNNRSVKINGTEVECDLWTPGAIRCIIDQQIHGAIEIRANGNVVANSVLRKFIGKFVYERYHGGVENANSAQPLKETIRLELVYRGFGKPCPPSVNRFSVQSLLAEGTAAHVTFSGSASISTPPVNGCVRTTSVALPTTSRWEFLLPPSLSDLMTGLSGQVQETAGGIDVIPVFNLNDVVTGVKIRRQICDLTGEEPVAIGSSLAGFNYKPINLEFEGTSGLRLKGTHELKTSRMASGILGEAWDGNGNPSHYERDGLMQAILRHDY